MPFHFLTSKGWWVSSFAIVRNTGFPFQQHPLWKCICRKFSPSASILNIKGMWNFQRSRTMAPMCSSNKIASLRTDVCPKCESLRWYVIGAVSEEAKLTALDDYKSHVEISQDIFISKSTLVLLHLHLCPSHLLSEHIYKCIVEYKCIKINVGWKYMHTSLTLYKDKLKRRISE